MHVTHPLSNILLPGQGMNESDIFISKASHCHLVVLPGDMVGVDDGGKDREPIGSVE